MSGSGSGRGRGWLNLNKNSATTRPGGLQTTNSLPNNVASTNIAVQTTTKEVKSVASHKYSNLISIIEKLDGNDDGILLNQKLQFIIQTWTQECSSSTEVEESFEEIYGKCLSDVCFATKVVLMVSPCSFNTVEIHSVKIRNLFITNMQKGFENSKQLQMTNPGALRTTIRMLGEFYHKARLPDGRHIKFLAIPIVRCFEMLLQSSEEADLELFTSQWYLNGTAIQNECPEQLQNVLCQLRRLLVNNVNLTEKCRCWLLLALEVFYNRFGVLPTELQQFYHKQLGDKAIANFQGTPCALSIQTFHKNKSLDNYRSIVSVLQVTPPESTSPVTEQNESSSTSQSYNSEMASDWEANFKDDGGQGAKVGRPILGAGARLNKNKGANEEWREGACKENSSGWNSRQKLGGKAWSSGGNGTTERTGHAGGGGSNNNSSSKRGQTGSKKGWEHDDRFFNDY